MVPPPHKSLTIDTLYKGGKFPTYLLFNNELIPIELLSIIIFENLGKPDWKLLLENLKREGRVDRDCFVKLANDTIALLSKE